MNQARRFRGRDSEQQGLELLVSYISRSDPISCDDAGMDKLRAAKVI
jgi:hypothetical protein